MLTAVFKIGSEDGKAGWRKGAYDLCRVSCGGTVDAFSTPELPNVTSI